MQMGIMITNGGTHPPEKWAAMTASQIIQVSSTAVGAAAAVGRRLELKILDILEEAHARVQGIEKNALGNIGIDYLAGPLDPREHVEAPLQAIVEAAKGTPHEAHFALETTKDYLRKVLAQHFGTAMHIERSTYADGMPGHPIAIAYKEKYNNGIEPL
jgi:hypothetical protein